jgi:hypothetical protein
MTTCKCGCGEIVRPPNKAYVNKEHQIEHLLAGEAARTQERSDEKVAGCATLALSLPTLAVIGPDGTEVGGFSYRGAMVHRARYGGELRVEGP